MVTCQSANQLKTPAKVSWAFKMVSQFGSLGYTFLHKEWTEAGVKASRATTHRRVKEFGYSCRQRRLTWAREKKNWTVAQWTKVLFSDESKFCISFGNQGPRVWRKGGEAHSPSCLKSSVKFPTVCDDLGCNVICCCWSIVFFENQRHCTRLPSTFWSTSCFLLLTSFLKMLISFSSRIWHLPTLPKAQQVRLNDHSVGVLDWPANSPDLNLIENLQGIIKRKMRNKTREQKMMRWDELKATVKEPWASIPPQQCHKLITSMPRRIEAVIKAKGAPTKYWVHIQ